MRNTLLLTALLIGTAPAVFAAPPVQTAAVGLSGVSQPGDMPAQAFRHVLYNLRAGGPYNRAVAQLQFCTAHDPKNRLYHLTLGCAYADHAASVGYSAMWTAMLTEERSHYPQAMKDWQSEQADPAIDHALSDIPRPTPPPDVTFPTKDDDQPFTLSAPQSAVLVRRLSLSAQAEWKRSVTLSATPAERADAEWVQGCGLRLLRLAQLKDGPSQREVVTTLTAAAKDAPQNALYWQSLGDALRSSEDDKAGALALAAYDRSLGLQPVNAPLWFRLYRTQFKSTRDAQPEVEAALRHVIDSDPDNAYPRYLLAALLFRRTHFSDINGNGPEGVALALAETYSDVQYQDANAALSQLEMANSASHYAVPEYVSPTPELLTGFDIWQPVSRAYDSVFGEMGHLRELARAASGYSRICAAHGDQAGLERGARAAIGMGAKMAGDWPLRDSPDSGSETTTALIGFAVIGIGYNSLVKGYAQLGDDPAAQAVQAEWDAFKARRVAWQQARAAATKDDTAYSDY